MTVATPTAMSAAAAMATRAEMLRMIFLWRAREGELGFSGEEEDGSRTMGFGRVAGQEELTAAPQREGFPATDEGGMVLKKLPEGR